MQTLNTLSTPEEKLAALCKKYAELVSAGLLQALGLGEDAAAVRRQKLLVDTWGLSCLCKEQSRSTHAALQCLTWDPCTAGDPDSRGMVVLGPGRQRCLQKPKEG